MIAMRKLSLCAAFMLLCGGCTVPPPPPEPVATVPAAPPECRNITVTATIDGKPQEVNGFVCRAADGSWQFASPFDQPLYLPPPYEYAYYEPLWGWWWPPFGVGLGTDFFFAERHFDHFHRFVRRDRGFTGHGNFSHHMHS